MSSRSEQQSWSMDRKHSDTPFVMREQGEVKSWLVQLSTCLFTCYSREGRWSRMVAESFLFWIEFMLLQTNTPSSDTDEPVMKICCEAEKYLYMIFLFDKTGNVRAEYHKLALIILDNDAMYLSIHVTEHEIQQEALALPEGSSHWQHHYIFIPDLRSQENPSQRICVQSKGVILLAHSDNLNWAWFTPHFHQSWDL